MRLSTNYILLDKPPDHVVGLCVRNGLGVCVNEPSWVWEWSFDKGRHLNGVMRVSLESLDNHFRVAILLMILLVNLAMVLP